ncbi:MAG TPA: hypothetical protein VFZ25_05955 [Chloroflexota bacterium]|nr:hypothetical protein [Chloroflexota bacterium]
MSARCAPLEALLAWQRFAGPYWPYVCSAPFLAEGITPRPVLPKPTAASHALVSSIGQLSEIRPLVVVDLPTELTLAALPALHQLGYRVVPIIQRWIVPDAVLPSRRLLNALVGSIARRAPRPAEPARGVVLCLDGERGGNANSPAPSPARFDNRYAYPICRFPPRRFLTFDGVTGVYWISNGPLAEDLLPYRESLTPDLPSLDVNLAEPARAALGGVR